VTASGQSSNYAELTSLSKLGLSYYADMADPRNAMRGVPLTGMRAAIHAAAAVAASRSAAAPTTFWDEDDDAPAPPPSRPHALPVVPPPPPIQPMPRKFYNPQTGDEMPEWEYEEWVKEEEEMKAAEKNAEREREARRDEMQYKTAFRTAFELGLKAGRMQRLEPQPCEACNRRKERNRIAAQASRLEKKRLERAAAGILEDAPRYERRRTGGAAPPQMPIVTHVAGIKHSREEEEESEEEGEMPPF